MYKIIIYDKNIIGDIMFLEILYKALLFYFLLTIIIRFLGKREVGKINVFDFVLLLLIADIASIAIENKDINYLYVVVVLLVLAFIQKMVSLINLKFYKVRKFIDGKPSVLVFNGEIQFEALKKNLYTIEDLMIEMRSNSVKSIKDIELAILEINGKLNIFKRDPQDKNIPLAVIASGNVILEHLQYFKKTKEEILLLLKEKNVAEQDVLYATFIDEELYLIEQKKS